MNRNHVVVLLTASACESYPGRPCVMEVLGPYTRGEAEAVAGQKPEWTAPHLMVLRRDEASLDEERQ